METPKIRWPFGEHVPFLAPSAEIGTDGNVTEINSDGKITLKGDAVMYKDIICPIIQRTTGVGRPTLEAFVGNIRQYQFDVNDATELEPTELQHDYEEGTDIEFHVHWATGGMNDGTVRGVKWEIEYAIRGLNGVFDATEIISAETEIKADEPDRAMKFTSVGVVPGSGLTIGSQVVFMIKRIAAEGAAPANDPFVLDIGIHYKVNTLGSTGLITK